MRDIDKQLFMAVAMEDTKLVGQLIKQGANVNAKDKDGDTPLHIASLKGYYNIVKLFLNHGADVNVRDNDGWTPLHYAVVYGQYITAELLLEYGADVNVRDKYGNTPLHYAVMHGDLNAVEVLINHGANANVKNKYGKTPLDIVREEGYKDIERLLLTYISGHFKILSASYSNYIVSIVIQANVFPIELSVSDYDIAPRLLFGEVDYSTEPPSSVDEVLSSGLYNEKGESVDNIQIFSPNKKVKLEFYLTDTSPPYDEPAVLVIPYKKIGEERIKYAIIQNVIIKGLTKTK